MENSILCFSALKAGRSNQKVVARLLRFWEARNVKKGGELMGVDMLLLDEKSTLIQGSIHVQQLHLFKERMQTGNVYAISGFDVVRSNHHFKMCESNISIRFTQLTNFQGVPDPICPIPKEMFKFRNHDQLVALANTNTELPDIIGDIKIIKAVMSDNTQATQRIMTLIGLNNGVTVWLSAFDSLATMLNHKLQTYGEEPRVIVATNINPKFVGGKLFLNATSATHFYFDADVEASKSYIEAMKISNGGNSPMEGHYRGVQKLESITVGELNDYILKSAPQDIEFLCTTTITAIQTKKGWSYISCSKCSKKLQRGISSFSCKPCHDANAIGVLRYRVEMVVSDISDTAVFTAFDTDITKLTNVRAADAAGITEGVQPGEMGEIIPAIITDLVGKKYTFQLKLTEYNFTSKHQSFTVSRIFDAPEVVPQPTFANTVGNDQTVPTPAPFEEESNNNGQGISVPSTTSANQPEDNATGKKIGKYEDGTTSNDPKKDPPCPTTEHLNKKARKE